MGYIISVGIASVFCLYLFLSSRSDSVPVVEKGEKRTAAYLILFLWIGLHTGCNSIHQIANGHVGVVYGFGKIQGQIANGLHITYPWLSIKVENTLMEKHEYRSLTASSAEGHEVSFAVTFFTQASPQAIQDLHRRIGAKWYKDFVAPKMFGGLANEIAKYKDEDVLLNSEKIGKAVSKSMQDECAPYSIEVSDLRIRDIHIYIIL